MELLIKQRVFSWTDSYDVYNPDGSTRYTVKSEFLSLGHQIHVYGPYGEVGAIHQKLFRFLPEFELEIGGKTVGSVQKQFSLFRPAYTVDCCGWNVQGDFLGWDYNVIGSYGIVAHISKKILTWGDTYILNIASAADELPALLLALAIDAANCSGSD